ncbi:metallophosphoesterase [Patescibacteria group bacterium]|nr:metallophosphoesterase [Patescibacteria group bacterium]
MKIAIVSDSHDNLATAKKAIAWLNKEKIKTLLHCGDVCSPSMLRAIAKLFKGKVYLVFGNVDGDRFNMLRPKAEGKLKNVVFCGDSGEITVAGKKIAFCHFPLTAQGLAASKKYDFVFYGHTHRPWEEKIGKTKLVNPGTLAGMFNKATFAVYDTKTDKLELKLVERLSPHNLMVK